MWSDFDVDRRTARATPLERALAAVTGRDGTFRMCGLPVERSILMQAQFGDHGTTGAVQVEVPTSGVLVESLQLNVGDVGTTSITGHVRREGSQSAIAGARVHVFGDTGEVVTAADGSFKLDRVSIGTQSVEVTALGFYPRRYALDVRPTSTSNVTITLLELATVLDSVNIVAQRSGAEMPHPEFDQRSAHGHGVYITEGMIAKAAPLETANLFQQINGLNVLNGAITSSRGITSILVSGQNSDRICQPTLYVDGTPVSMGNLNDTSPSAIYGIEVYVSSATAPAKYHAGLCGLILIWTR